METDPQSGHLENSSESEVDKNFDFLPLENDENDLSPDDFGDLFKNNDADVFDLDED